MITLSKGCVLIMVDGPSDSSLMGNRNRPLKRFHCELNDKPHNNADSAKQMTTLSFLPRQNGHVHQHYHGSNPRDNGSLLSSCSDIFSEKIEGQLNVHFGELTLYILCVGLIFFLLQPHGCQNSHVCSKKHSTNPNPDLML